MMTKTALLTIRHLPQFLPHYSAKEEISSNKIQPSASNPNHPLLNHCKKSSHARQPLIHRWQQEANHCF